MWVYVWEWMCVCERQRETERQGQRHKSFFQWYGREINWFRRKWARNDTGRKDYLNEELFLCSFIARFGLILSQGYRSHAKLSKSFAPCVEGVKPQWYFRVAIFRYFSLEYTFCLYACAYSITVILISVISCIYNPFKSSKILMQISWKKLYLLENIMWVKKPR